MAIQNNIREQSYLGNTNIKRAGAPVNLTQEQVDEWFKCADDPIYFAEQYIKIVHVDDGLIPIELYDFQKDIITAFKENRKSAINTSRQAGKTTTAVCLILHYVLFNKSKQVGILSNKKDAAVEVLERIQIAYEALPKWIQMGVKEWNKGSMVLENGCKIIASATLGSAARGKSFSFLYIDEAAFVENWSKFSSSVLPTITSGKKTKLLYTSTPNGMNHFYSIVTKGKKGKNGFKVIEVPWWEVPGRDEEWKEEVLNGLCNGDAEQFAQEYCCEFHGSSGTLIAGWKLKEMVSLDPVHSDDSLTIYEQPTGNHQYVITADVSRGKGLDYSAFHVIDVTGMPYKQVATYRSNMVTPVDYADILAHVGRYYNTASILVEINDIGGQVVDILHHDNEYESILYTENRGRVGKQISFGGNVLKAERGIRTTITVKREGCSLLKLLLEQNQLIINDEETIFELATFSKKGAGYEAETGKNDDLVMGLVIFSWLSAQEDFTSMTDVDTMSKLRDKTEEEIMDSLLPFGIVDTGIDYIDDDSNDTFFNF